jgi:undecaprenyl-diphosphatase
MEQRGVEHRIVQACVRSARHRPARLAAIWLTRLGNGWLYPGLAALLLAVEGGKAWPIIAAATAAIALLQLLAGMMKRRLRRARPFEAMAGLDSLLPVQDRHSFPSGHVMTLTAALVPAVLAFPVLAGPAILAWAAMAWSRMACAHHYPSDVLAGTALAFALAWPLSLGVLSIVGG